MKALTGKLKHANNEGGTATPEMFDIIDKEQARQAAFDRRLTRESFIAGRDVDYETCDLFDRYNIPRPTRLARFALNIDDYGYGYTA